MRTESYPGNLSQNLLRATIAFIVEKQKDDGSIPWFEGGVVDPWTHLSLIHI